MSVDVVQGAWLCRRYVCRRLFQLVVAEVVVDHVLGRQPGRSVC